MGRKPNLRKIKLNPEKIVLEPMTELKERQDSGLRKKRIDRARDWFKKKFGITRTPLEEWVNGFNPRKRGPVWTSDYVLRLTRDIRNERRHIDDYILAIDSNISQLENKLRNNPSVNSDLIFKEIQGLRNDKKD